jgi:hypothetical protein
MHTALLRDDAMLQAVVEFDAAVYGNDRSAAGLTALCFTLWILEHFHWLRDAAAIVRCAFPCTLVARNPRQRALLPAL